MIEEYIRRYGARLYGLCRTLCSNIEDADDLYQDTWLAALRHFSKYDPSRTFEPWLTRICVNTYRNMRKRASISPIHQNFSSTEEKDTLMKRIPAANQKDYLLLYEAIDKLPEKLRLTVILFYFRDMDLEETANALSIPKGTVKSRLHNARITLKEVLQNDADLQF